MGIDFCIDEGMELLYLTTHRQNTIARVSMNPAGNNGFTQSVAGDPYVEELIGPPSGIWGRGAGEYGRVTYFVSDGGTASPPPDRVVRAAKSLQVTARLHWPLSREYLTDRISPPDQVLLGSGHRFWVTSPTTSWVTC